MASRPFVDIIGPTEVFVRSGAKTDLYFSSRAVPTGPDPSIDSAGSGRVVSYLWSVRSFRTAPPIDLVTDEPTLRLSFTNTNTESTTRYGSYNIALAVEFENLNERVPTNQVVRVLTYGVAEQASVPDNVAYTPVTYSSGDDPAPTGGGIAWDTVTGAYSYRIEVGDSTLDPNRPGLVIRQFFVVGGNENIFAPPQNKLAGDIRVQAITNLGRGPWSAWQAI